MGKVASFFAFFVLFVFLSACGDEHGRSRKKPPFYESHSDLAAGLSSDDGFAFFSGHFPVSHSHPTIYVDKEEMKFVVTSKIGRYEFSSLEKAVPTYKWILGDLGYGIPGESIRQSRPDQVLIIDVASLSDWREFDPAVIERIGLETRQMLGKVSSYQGLAYLTGFADRSRDHPAIFGMSKKLYVMGQGTSNDGFEPGDFDSALSAYRDLLAARDIPEAF